MNPKIQKRANVALADHTLGLIKARRLKHFTDMRVIDIGMHYRLVSFDCGATFEIMTHNAYERHISRNKARVGSHRRKAK